MIRLAIVAAFTPPVVLSTYAGACVALAAWGSVRYGTVARWRFRGLLARRINLDGFRDRCGIYVHWWLFLPLYVGQTIDADDRMRSHGKDIRTQCYTHCTFFPVDPARLNEVEKWLHHRLPWTQWLGFNRTGGGS